MRAPGGTSAAEGEAHSGQTDVAAAIKSFTSPAPLPAYPPVALSPASSLLAADADMDTGWRSVPQTVTGPTVVVLPSPVARSTGVASQAALHVPLHAFAELMRWPQQVRAGKRRLV
jgi:hypothetical protein